MPKLKFKKKWGGDYRLEPLFETDKRNVFISYTVFSYCDYYYYENKSRAKELGYYS